MRRMASSPRRITGRSRRARRSRQSERRCRSGGATVELPALADRDARRRRSVAPQPLRPSRGLAEPDPLPRASARRSRPTPGDCRDAARPRRASPAAVPAGRAARRTRRGARSACSPARCRTIPSSRDAIQREAEAVLAASGAGRRSSGRKAAPRCAIVGSVATERGDYRRERPDRPAGARADRLAPRRLQDQTAACRPRSPSVDPALRSCSSRSTASC